jgi:hypothetical protein
MYAYRIQGLDLCGNPIHSFSDTSQAMPDNILQFQQVDVVRGTVIDNRYVLVEWKAPAVAPDKVARYNIYRSDNATNYKLIASTPAGAFDYIDTDVNVHKNFYYYQIQVVNFCEINTLPSNLGSSVLLKASRLGEGTILEWTPYNGWDTGVNSYIIEKQDHKGDWIILKQVNASTTKYEDN